jgi:hypothetical protein
MAEETVDPFAQIGSNLGPIDFNAPSFESYTPQDPTSIKESKPVDQAKMFDDYFSEISKNVFSEPTTQKKQENIFGDLGFQLPQFQKPAEEVHGVYYATPDIDKYVYQDDFIGRGFNPANPTNEEKWVADETWSSAMDKALDGFSSRFGNTFHDYWKSYGRIGSAVYNWDLSKLMPSESEMMAQYYEDQKNAMKNFVFVEPSEQDSLFSKKNVADFVSNAGFALGSFGGLAIELAADAALTAITLPAGGEGGASFFATGARLMGKLGLGKKAVEAGETIKTTTKVDDLLQGFRLGVESPDAIRQAGTFERTAAEAEALGKLKTSSDAAKKVIKDYSRMFTMNIGDVIKSKSFAEFSMNAAKGIPLIGEGVVYGEKIAAGAQAGLSGAKLAGIGLRGMHRLIQEYNLSSSEAAFESVSSYGDYLDQMVKEHRDSHNGESPTAEEFTKMKDFANQSAFSNYKTNMAILLTTNRLQFGNLLGKIAPANKFTNELLQDGAENILGVNRVFKSSDLLAREYNKGFFGTYGLLGKISTDFGKKQALFELGNALRKDLFKFQLTEGLQENMQEASSIAWREYYANKYRGVNSTIEEAFGKGVEAQFTKQGLNTFLQGALTGTLIAVPTHVATHAIQGIQNKAISYQYRNDPEADPIAKMEKDIEDGINFRNDLYKKMSDGTMTESKIFNVTTQIEAALQQTEAAAKNSEYEWHNAHDNSVLSAALSANQMGTIDVLIDAFKDMGKSMTEEDLEKQWGIKLSDTKYSTPADFMNSVAKDLRRYSDIVDGLRKKIKSTTDPMMYQMGSRDRIIAAMIRKTQEDAVRIIAANALKSTMAVDRMKKLHSEISSIEELSNTSDMVLRVLTDPEKLKSEMDIVNSEIFVLENTIADRSLSSDVRTAARKQLIAKGEILIQLENWSNYWSTREEILQGDEVDEENEPVKVKKTVLDSFIGKKNTFKSDEKDDDGNVVDKKDTYNQYHEDVVETFRKILNAKNRDMDIDAQVSENTMREAFTKVVDYIQLSRDAQDYIQAHDVIFNPEYAKQMLLRMMDGNLKYEAVNFLQTLKNRIRITIEQKLIDLKVATRDNIQGINEKIIQKQKNRDLDLKELFTEEENLVFDKLQKHYSDMYLAVYNSSAYKSLMAFAIDPKMGFEQQLFVFANIKLIQSTVIDKLKELVNSYNSTPVTEETEVVEEPEVQEQPEVEEPVTDDEFESFKNGIVAESLLISIGNKPEEARSERERIIFESKKEQIENLLRVTAKKEPEPASEKDINIEKFTIKFEEGKWKVYSNGESLGLSFNTKEEAVADVEKAVQELKNSEIEEQTEANAARLADVESLPEVQEINREIAEIQNEIDSLPGKGLIVSTGKFGRVFKETDERRLLTAKINELKKRKEELAGGIGTEEFNVIIPNANDNAPAENHTEVVKNPESGYDVITVDNVVVNETPIPTRDAAEKKSEEINTNVDNFNFVNELVQKYPNVEEPVKLTIVNMGLNAMDRYNQSSKDLKFQSLREFYEHKKGRKYINEIVLRVIENKTKSQAKKEGQRATVKVKRQVDKNDVSNLDSQTESPTKEIDDNIVKLGEKFVDLQDASEEQIENFKKEENITASDITNIIDDITGCIE